MFFRKITSRSNGKEYNYLKLIENYREGDKVKQRVVANLGSMENLKPDKVQGLISGLSRICGVSSLAGQLEAKRVLRYGDVLAIHKIYELLQISRAINEATGNQTDFNALLLFELMALKQVIKPYNKQSAIDWCKFIYIPELENRVFTNQQLWEALNLVDKTKGIVEEKIFRELCSLVTIDTDLAFCRLTTCIFKPVNRDGSRPAGCGKFIADDRAGRQKIDFGVLASRDGIPFGHRLLQVVPEEWEYKNILDDLRDAYGVKKCVFVGERSLVSSPKIELIADLGYEYMVGHKFFTYWDRDLINREMVFSKDNFQEYDDDLWFKEVAQGEVRYLLCYNPKVAEEKAAVFRERLDSVENELIDLKGGVADNQACSKKLKFSKKASILKDNLCLRCFEWYYNDSTNEFNFRRNESLISQELNLAGVFLLETNSRELSANEIIESYNKLDSLSNSMRDIRNFEPRTNQMCVENRISAAIFIRVLAATLEKTLERLIDRAGLNLKSRQALEMLEEIKVAVNQLDDMEVKSVTRIGKTQQSILRAIGIDDIQRTII